MKEGSGGSPTERRHSCCDPESFNPPASEHGENRLHLEIRYASTAEHVRNATASHIQTTDRLVETFAD